MLINQQCPLVLSIDPIYPLDGSEAMMNNQRPLTLTNTTFNGAAYHQKNNVTQVHVTRDASTPISEGPPLTPPIITHTDATPQGSPNFTGLLGLWSAMKQAHD